MLFIILFLLYMAIGLAWSVTTERIDKAYLIEKIDDGIEYELFYNNYWLAYLFAMLFWLPARVIWWLPSSKEDRANWKEFKKRYKATN